ncbi:MAG TPA: AAA family ATPase, partial [Candidatus Limnocylindrales bacterium]|nr:AAA family ATPase [Candidatus Limnocylindrales bacterium]
MTATPAPPRLLALRVQGFKSFAERTNVEFGGGISAVVGPNGSGKSNLADALRWALGEQGRALRSRKAEDVIWAGSEKRTAQGMADVTLVLDNADALLPVDFQVLEFGRRLYRSGENEYLLNKQRIRLRDLVDLLDAAHLADNAFLFIGQGMVDQALALRPEERRPLFEEVAGVRRHERRRRKAEEQLAESEANLARVDDILAELRPQARRLAAQAEQQTARSTIADELASALLASTHARWHEAAARLAVASERRLTSDADAARAMADLASAEAVAAALAGELAARADAERERREAHETARAALTELQLSVGRLGSELDAIERDRTRLSDERATAEADLANQRRAVVAPVPTRDLDLEAAVGAAERELAEALSELATLRSESTARGEDAAAIRRAEAARTAEAETARRRLAEAERQAATERSAAETAVTRREEAVTRSEAARRALEFAVAAERAALTTVETARASAEAADAERASSAERLAAASTAAAALRARVEALAGQLDEDERRPIARAAKKAGGRRLDEDLVVDAELRAAVEAALADRARAYLVAAAAVADLAGERGRLVVEERLTGSGGAQDAATRRWLDAVAAAGGGRLAEAVRRDATGGVRRLLERTVWLPDLEACLAVQPQIPPGWTAVPRDGSAVLDDTGVALGAADGALERRADHARLSSDLERLDGELAALRTHADDAARAAEDARSASESARAEASRLAGERRRMEEAERAAVRETEVATREASWHMAQQQRLDADVSRLRDALPSDQVAKDTAADEPGEGPAIATWQARADELRERRDRLAARLADYDGTRRDGEHARARAEAAVAMADERIARTDRESAALVEREAALVTERDRLATEIAVAATRERDARDALAALHSADAADRSRLAEAERTATAARERLRAADDRVRAADHAELEARLGLESLRDGVLVELAGLGDLGLASLGVRRSSAASYDPATDGEADVPDDAAALESALTEIAERWATEPPPAD